MDVERGERRQAERCFGTEKDPAERGVAVPDELSVAGFDDIFGSELIVPALTTVRSQLVEAGARALQMILSGLEGEDPIDLGNPLLETVLVVRGSTGVAAR